MAAANRYKLIGFPRRLSRASDFLHFLYVVNVLSGAKSISGFLDSPSLNNAVVLALPKTPPLRNV